MLRAAISHFKKEFELKRLKESAVLYSEIYSEDKDLSDLSYIFTSVPLPCSYGRSIDELYIRPATCESFFDTAYYTFLLLF